MSLLCLINSSFKAQSKKSAVGECEQKTPFDHWSGASTDEAAFDIQVPTGQSFKYYGMKTTFIFLDDLDGALDYTLYADNNGLPGQVIKQFSGTVKRAVYIGMLGKDIYLTQITVMFDDPLELPGGKKYWISAKRKGWALNDAATRGIAAFFEDGKWKKHDVPSDLAFELLCDADVLNYDCTQHSYSGFVPNFALEAPEIKRGNYESANDIFIEKNKSFNLTRIDPEVIVTSSEELPQDFDVTIYSDKNNAPDQVIASFSKIKPASLTKSALYPDVKTYAYLAKLILPQAVSLNGGSNGTRYWIGLKGVGTMDNDYEVNVRWISYPYDAGSNSKPVMIRVDDPNASWTQYSTADTDSYETGFDVYGDCKDALAVNENNRFNFQYYPNPTKNFIDIKSDKKIESISFFALDGKKVLGTNVKANENRISLATLPVGLYIMEAKFEDGSSKNFKIIKQ